MFESYTDASIIGLLFPSTITNNGRRLNSLLEDLYPEFCRYGIDILMMSGNRYYDEQIYPWQCIYSDEPLYTTIRETYDIYNTPSFIFVDKHGNIVDYEGKDMIFNLSNMYEPNTVSRMIASEFFEDAYDSDW